MTKTEMIDFLRGKKLLKAPENNDELLEGLKMLDTIFDEIADELEQSERVVHGHWVMRMHYENYDGGYPLYHCSLCNRARPHKLDNYCPECGAKMDEVNE